MPSGPVLSRRTLLVSSSISVATIAGGLTALAVRANADGRPESATAGLALSVASGGVSGGTAVTVTGGDTADVRSVLVGSQSAAVTHRTASEIRFTTPQAAEFRPASTSVALRSASGAVIARLPFRYEMRTGVDRQLRYLLTYWQHYNPAYTTIDGDDCVDFASQSLLQRGWKQQGEWTSDAADIYDAGAAWRSSTSFMDFMTEHPELGTALTDDQRSKVKLGDIVQFDWDDSGDRDHTGVVTRVAASGGRVQIDFAGHTDDSDYRSVDTAITKDHPGGRAYYWSLA